MKVVVTGATGNLGTSVLEALARYSEVESIVGVARRSPSRSFAKTRFATADITEGGLEELLRGADSVVHLAWQIQPSREPERLDAVNVKGSKRVFEAALEAQVPHLVFASSVGAYSPGPKDKLVDEGWPTEGTPGSLYAQQKAEVERIADRVLGVSSMRVARMRPALVFKFEAASEIRRLFFGTVLPRRAFDRRSIRVVPKHDLLRFQVVHSKDVGEAFARAVVRGATGAFNLAAQPVLDGETVARALGARTVSVPRPLMRASAAIGYHLRLQAADPSWLDMAMSVPLMDTARAQRELGWSTTREAEVTLFELLDGIRQGGGGDTAPLQAS